MTPLQRKYLSLLAKDRHNDLVYQYEIGNPVEKGTGSEIEFIEELFQSGILDAEAVYPITLDKG